MRIFAWIAVVASVSGRLLDLTLDDQLVDTIDNIAGQLNPSDFGVRKEVPGGSPIEICADDEKQLIDIDFVEIVPNPPELGQNLTVTASGTVNKDIVEGSYVDVSVSYGLIRLLNKRYDLCEILPEADLECPVKAGKLTLTRTFELPAQVPPGEYIVQAKAYTPDSELLVCLFADVVFDA